MDLHSWTVTPTMMANNTRQTLATINCMGQLELRGQRGTRARTGSSAGAVRLKATTRAVIGTGGAQRRKEGRQRSAIRKARRP
mmetsp:Transcript_45947/g.88545  ORF Transcript_45947/g.88545 Transcript_45947/m.88545 type:complete len:83 (-) Transcript_45947:177-425(-)